jgi:hypothetical protein
VAEKDMIKAVQAALDDQDIDDTIREVGEFMPRGVTGSMFAGGMIGSDIGGAVGLGVGSLGGIAAATKGHGMPMRMLVGASDSAVYGFKEASGGRRKEPHEIVFQAPREGLAVKVRGRVNVRILELIDEKTGSKIELEGNRLPITHSHDLIKFVAGDKAVSEADAVTE